MLQLELVLCISLRSICVRLLGCGMLKCSKDNYFPMGEKFTPVQQLMAVLPPKSARPAGIMEEMRELMINPFSPVIDFYPDDFALDLNGKKFLWQAVVLLPFMKEERLIEALKPYMDMLEGDDKI